MKSQSELHMKASDYIAKFLYEKQANVVFEMAGGMITNLIDSMHRHGKFTLISVHHEQAAAFAVDGFSRVANRPVVGMATSGPGATNLLTGIGSCYFDSVPAIFITGQVNTNEINPGNGVRQLGFQETDIVAMAKPITKHAICIRNVNQIVPSLDEAYRAAVSGRPGPVPIDIPMNIQRADLPTTESEATQEGGSGPGKPDSTQLLGLAQDIENARRPILLVGRGVRVANARNSLNRFIEKTHIPVVTSLLGVDLIDFDSQNRVGFIGSYGNRWANIALGSADLILAVGSRLDIRQTGADTEFFKSKKIYQVDVNRDEFNFRLKNTVGIWADAKAFFEDFLRETERLPFGRNEAWYAEIQNIKEKYPDISELYSAPGLNPNKIVHSVCQLFPDSEVFVSDVGSHQMWVAQSIEIRKGQLFITSGGMGAMGYALPASIGACLAVGKRPVVVFCGDGGIQLNIQELQTIVHNELPIHIVVFNNRSLGMIRQFQDSYFEGRHHSTVLGYSAPDFVKLAQAYGIRAMRVSNMADLEKVRNWSGDHMRPSLIEVEIDPKTNAYPKIAFGKPITEMEPFAKPIDIEGT